MWIRETGARQPQWKKNMPLIRLTIWKEHGSKHWRLHVLGLFPMEGDLNATNAEDAKLEAVALLRAKLTEALAALG